MEYLRECLAIHNQFFDFVFRLAYFSPACNTTTNGAINSGFT